MSAVADLDLFAYVAEKDLYGLICARIQMIGPVNNLFPGRLSTATVLGNYYLHAEKNLSVCRPLIHLTCV